MVSYEHVLPIGSVVLLKGATKRLMIIGYQRKGASDSKVYDYCGCTYPEGFLSTEDTAIFDHEQIDRIIAIGLQNPVQIDFSEKLKEVIAGRNA